MMLCGTVLATHCFDLQYKAHMYSQHMIYLRLMSFGSLTPSHFWEMLKSRGHITLKTMLQTGLSSPSIHMYGMVRVNIKDMVYLNHSYRNHCRAFELHCMSWVPETSHYHNSKRDDTNMQF